MKHVFFERIFLKKLFGLHKIEIIDDDLATKLLSEIVYRNVANEKMFRSIFFVIVLTEERVKELLIV